MKHVEKYLSIALLLFAIGFNLWLYRTEPTAMVDPNDNAFQYALIDRTNQVWDYGNTLCQNIKASEHHTVFSLIHCRLDTLRLLSDHWVPNWAQGYNLPYYYSHVPQILIVGSYRSIQSISQFTIHNVQFTNNVLIIKNLNLIENLKLKIENYTLFTHYHFIIYLLLSLFPLSVFLALRVLGLSWTTVGIGALLASHISTDGLYGLDQSSYLWRGWGLSSQLFAAMFLPLAIAYSIKWMNRFTIGRLNGRQFIEELKTRALPFWGKNSSARLHLAREKNDYDKEEIRRASLINSSTGQLSKSSFICAVFFITAVTAGHLGIGMMLFLGLPVIALSPAILSLLTLQPPKIIIQHTIDGIKKTFLLALPPLMLLSYWIYPSVRDSIYHNISFWDPIWKFDSFGVKEVLSMFGNGDLFDFGRLPILTAFLILGFFVSFSIHRQNDVYHDEKNTQDSIYSYLIHHNSYFTVSFLFLFYLLLFFGRTTLSGLVNLIPGMKDFHMHRFIVGVHLTSLFLIPMGISWLIEKITFTIFNLQFSIKFQTRLAVGQVSIRRLADKFQIISIGLSIFCSILIVIFIYPQTLRYANYNTTLIKGSNALFEKEKPDMDKLVLTLKELQKTKPGRVFAGRGGGWGRDFKVANASSYYMYLSTYGIPTVLWLPETWSLNSDVEQYFSEENESHYQLFGIRYIVAPKKHTPQPFWKKIAEGNAWILYEVTSEPTTRNTEPISDYITTGTAPSVVYSDKESFGNVVRLWIQSEYPTCNLYPEIRVRNFQSNLNDKNISQRCDGLPCFEMADEATYITPDHTTHSLFAEPPVYLHPNFMNASPVKQFTTETIQQWNNSQTPPIHVLSQSSDTDMVFRATVEIQKQTDIHQPASPNPQPLTRNGEPATSCPSCVVILRQTYHPNWKATVNGKQIKPISVFPFYTAIRLEEPGAYEVVFSYQSKAEKLVLLIVSPLLLLGVWMYWYKKSQKRHSL